MKTVQRLTQQTAEAAHAQHSLDDTLDRVHAVVEALVIRQGVAQFAVTVSDRCAQVDPVS